jgi:hypothetical protein
MPRPSKVMLSGSGTIWAGPTWTAMSRTASVPGPGPIWPTRVAAPVLHRLGLAEALERALSRAARPQDVLY